MKRTSDLLHLLVSAKMFTFVSAKVCVCVCTHAGVTETLGGCKCHCHVRHFGPEEGRET